MDFAREGRRRRIGMKAIRLTTVAFSAALLCGVRVNPVFAQEYVKGRVLVRVSSEIESETENEVHGVCDDHGTKIEKRTGKKGVFALKTPKGKLDKDFVDELRGDIRIRFAEVDKITELPRMTGKPFHFPFDRGNNVKKYQNQAAKAQIDLVNASQSDGRGVVVAVLDTGTTPNHVALKNATLSGMNFVNLAAPPKDVADSPSSLAMGHGTMVSGVIALMAPNAKILPVRVLNGDGKGSTLDVILGIEYALQQGARVINMSFGSESVSEILDDVLEDAADKGAVLIASAGNEGKERLLSPACHKDVVSVGSIDDKNRKSFFSNYSKKLTVMAPGENIQSAYADGAYAAGSGTSFSAPLVSGLVATLISRYPNKPVDWILDQVRETCKKLETVNPSYKGKLGRGLIDAQKALEGNH